MIVMPGNNRGMVAGYLAGRFPGRIAHLYGIGGLARLYSFVPFALDNGRFPAWSNGTKWDEGAYIGMLDRVVDMGGKPEWLLVPDVVTEADETMREWDRWQPRLARYGWPLAMAVQDGMDPDCVPEECEVVFVGGSTEWKRRTMREWCDAFDRVHIGRINTGKWLWECDEAGAESCDGTGWFRGDQAQLAQLVRYLERSAAGAGNPRGGELFMCESQGDK